MDHSKNKKNLIQRLFIRLQMASRIASLFIALLMMHTVAAQSSAYDRHLQCMSNLRKAQESEQNNLHTSMYVKMPPPGPGKAYKACDGNSGYACRAHQKVCGCKPCGKNYSAQVAAMNSKYESQKMACDNNYIAEAAREKKQQDQANKTKPFTIAVPPAMQENEQPSVNEPKIELPEENRPSTIKTEELAGGIMDGLRQNEARNNELNKGIGELEKTRQKTENNFKKDSKDIFAQLLQRDQDAGYSDILYDDEYITLRYTLRPVWIKPCTYTETTGSSVVATETGSQVVYKEEKMSFTGYYYKASYEFINKKRVTLGIRGFLYSHSHFNADEHITPFGETGQCLGFDKPEVMDTYWHKFYYEWNFTMTDQRIKTTGNFWTEIKSEKPAWSLAYTVIQ
jgi:hypothetical protein